MEAAARLPRDPDERFRWELNARLAATTPKDQARGMFFNGCVNAVRRHAGEAAAAGLSSQKWVDIFNYPVSDFLVMAWPAIDRLSPLCGGREGALRRLGRQAVDDFLGSMTGKTLLGLVGREPRRLLSSTPASYRAALSYGERRLEFTGEKSARLVVVRDFMPAAYHEGVLAAAVEATGGRNVKVTSKSTGLLDATYEIHWE